METLTGKGGCGCWAVPGPAGLRRAPVPCRCPCAPRRPPDRHRGQHLPSKKWRDHPFSQKPSRAAEENAALSQELSSRPPHPHTLPQLSPALSIPQETPSRSEPPPRPKKKKGHGGKVRPRRTSTDSPAVRSVTRPTEESGPRYTWPFPATPGCRGRPRPLTTPPQPPAGIAMEAAPTLTGSPRRETSASLRGKPRRLPQRRGQAGSLRTSQRPRGSPAAAYLLRGCRPGPAVEECGTEAGGSPRCRLLESPGSPVNGGGAAGPHPLAQVALLPARPHPPPAAAC